MDAIRAQADTDFVGIQFEALRQYLGATRVGQERYLSMSDPD
jgi:hypothetical protein